jgi:hypothetical protein
MQMQLCCMHMLRILCFYCTKMATWWIVFAWPESIQKQECHMSFDHFYVRAQNHACKIMFVTKYLHLQK